MHPYALRAVRRVLDAGGSIPLPDAFDDLAELERLARAISRRPEPRFDEIGAPLYVKGEAFFPPTVGSIAWARRVADWFHGEPELAELALLYGLTLARSGEYRDLLDREKARAAVHRWALRSRVTVADAREVLALMFPPQRETEHAVRLKALRSEHGEDAAKWPEPALRECAAAWMETARAAEAAESDSSIHKSVIFHVMREFGGTLDYWIFEAPIDHLLAAADELLKRQEAELAAERRAAGGAATERWAVEAQTRFNLFARAFERKYGPPARDVSAAQNKPNPSAPPSSTRT